MRLYTPRVVTKCLNCRASLLTPPSRIALGRGKYCSTTCRSKSDSKKRGVETPNWKGDKISYSGIHTYIKRKFGIPQFCEHCGSTTEKRYEWANISKKYLRDRADWLRLCKSCHIMYDDVLKKGWLTRHALNNPR